MKKKIFILTCLFMGLGLTQLFAQDGNTRSVQYKAELGYYTYVFCGDEMVDIVKGTVMFHIIDHSKSGNWEWELAQAKGEATGLYGEVFELTESDKFSLPVAGLFVWHFNLRGSLGNHYLGTLTYNYLTDELTVGKTVCL
jgi:hypothetical protein